MSALVRLALAGDARATYTLWSNCHWQLLDFDSLRGAPPQRGRLGVRIMTGVNPWKGPHQSAVRNLILDFLKRTGVHRTVFPRLRLGRPFESRLFVNKKAPPDGGTFLLAERVGFEPTVGCPITSFQDWLLKPLGHLSGYRKTAETAVICGGVRGI